MKKSVTIAAVFIFTLISLSAYQPTIEGRWSIKKANDWYKDQPWLVGCNFTPSTAINQLEMWQKDTFDPETIDRELGYAAGIGMNTVRVYLHDLLWKQDSEGFMKRIDQYLGIADKHGIKTMFVFFDSCWNSFPKLGKQPDPKPHVHNSGWVQSPNIELLRDITQHKTLKPYVKGILTRFKDDDRILIWDLYNEPGNGRSTDKMRSRRKEAICLALLEHTFEWAREVNPSQPLTVAVWGDKQWIGPKGTLISHFVLANSDIISFHNYEPLESCMERVGSIKPQMRPIMCTEYLAREAESTFEDKLPYFKKHKIAAYNWGLVQGKIQTEYGWDSWKKKLKGEPKEWHHDILRKDGTPFRQSEVELMRELTGRGKK